MQEQPGGKQAMNKPSKNGPRQNIRIAQETLSAVEQVRGLSSSLKWRELKDIPFGVSKPPPGRMVLYPLPHSKDGVIFSLKVWRER